jgi:uncharacterized protein (DUF362 family)
MSFDPKRRRTLEALALLAGLAAAPTAARGEPKSDQRRARARRKGSRSTGPIVAQARRPGVRDSATGRVDQARLDEMLTRAVARATSRKTPVAAFRGLFRRSDVVGIKVGTLAGPGLSPHPELVAKLTEWLQQAGVKAGNIVVWDRTDQELSAAGYSLQRGRKKVRCFGTNQDYVWSPREWGAGGSCFPRLLLGELTALINVAVLKDHDLAGISAGLKNWYGAIHNPNKYHGDGCNPYIARLAAYPLIKSKLRLTVIDGLVAQCHAGPARSPRWVWPWNGVLVSTDPAAIDAVAWQVIEARRKQVGLKSLAAEGREPKWIQTAARLGLGEARLNHIRRVEV